MKPNLFYVLGIILTVWACSPAKKAATTGITQGITGRITVISGNRMPGEGNPPAVPKGVKTTVYVHEPTSQAQVKGEAPWFSSIQSRLVATVETDDTGAFTADLPEGSYSLFIARGNQFYANLRDVENRFAVFTVVAGQLTTANLVIREAIY